MKRTKEIYAAAWITIGLLLGMTLSVSLDNRLVHLEEAYSIQAHELEVLRKNFNAHLSGRERILQVTKNRR